MDEDQKGQVSRYLFGYTVADRGVHTQIPKVPPVNPTFQMGIKKAPKFGKTQFERRVMAKDLGCAIPGVAPVIPDTRDNLNQQMSVCHRLARGHPEPSRRTIRAMSRIIHSEFGKMEPIVVDTSREAFYNAMKERGDSLSDLDAIMAEWDRMIDNNAQFGWNRDWNAEMMRTDGFLKEESYENFKAPRSICSPSDAHKVFFDPWIRAAEHQIMTCKRAVKFVPVAERAKFVEERLDQPGCAFVAADGTAFESSHSKKIMRLHVLVLDLLITDPSWKLIRERILDTSRTHRVDYNEWFFEIVSVLFSGYRWTGFFNWLLSYVSALFVAKCSKAHVDFVAEGDDILMVVLSGNLNQAYYNLIGVDIKLEFFDRLGDASFVGNVYSDTAKVVKDPWKILLNFGWSSSQYAASNRETLSALARAKAFSLIHELPNCPIITDFALCVLRNTENVSDKMLSVMRKKRSNVYERAKFKQMLDDNSLEFLRLLAERRASVDDVTREFFAHRFGIPIGLQRDLEYRLQHLTNTHEFLSLDLSFMRILFEFCPQKRFEHAEFMWNNYVVSAHYGKTLGKAYNHEWKEPSVTLASFFPVHPIVGLGLPSPAAVAAAKLRALPCY